MCHEIQVVVHPSMFPQDTSKYATIPPHNVVLRTELSMVPGQGGGALTSSLLDTIPLLIQPLPAAALTCVHPTTQSPELCIQLVLSKYLVTH